MLNNDDENNSVKNDEDLLGIEKPCLKCQTEISALAEKCPQCGYEPSDEGVLIGQVMIVFGVIACLTFVGALVGIPLIIAGAYTIKHKESGKRPTNTAPWATLAHIYQPNNN